MLFLASSFIFARLQFLVSHRLSLYSQIHAPVLEPYLNRPFGHANVLRYTLAYRRSRCSVVIELDLQRNQLILCGSLPFLIFLLLGEGALPWWTTRVARIGTSRVSWRWS